MHTIQIEKIDLKVLMVKGTNLNNPYTGKYTKLNFFDDIIRTQIH